MRSTGSHSPGGLQPIALRGLFVLHSNRRFSLGMPPLVAVVKDSRDPRQSVQLAVALLRRGADPNARDSDGNTALSAAKAHRNISLVRVLTAAGARQ
jgi:ankyrin repeat protein